MRTAPRAYALDLGLALNAERSQLCSEKHEWSRHSITSCSFVWLPCIRWLFTLKRTMQKERDRRRTTVPPPFSPSPPTSKTSGECAFIRSEIKTGGLIFWSVSTVLVRTKFRCTYELGNASCVTSMIPHLLLCLKWALHNIMMSYNHNQFKWSKGRLSQTNWVGLMQSAKRPHQVNWGSAEEEIQSLGRSFSPQLSI